MANDFDRQIYTITTEVKGRGGVSADVKVGVSVETADGELKELDYPEQCKSLPAYLAFDKIVKAFDQEARTAVDIAAELVATTVLRVMVLDNNVIFPARPTARWMAAVLRRYPKLIDAGIKEAKRQSEANKHPETVTRLIEYLAKNVLDPEDISRIVEGTLKEMCREVPCEGNRKHNVGEQKVYTPKRRETPEKKEKKDGKVSSNH